MSQDAGSPLASPEAFATFYERRSEQVLRFFARRVFDPQTAMDLTAETFAQAFVSRRRFRHGGEREALAWLHVIAKRQLSRYYRKGSAESRALARLGLHSPELGAEDMALVSRLGDLDGRREVVRQALAQLSADHRRALQLRIVEERSYAELARSLEVSEQTARARVSRGLRALAQALGDDPSLGEVAS